MPPLMFFCGFGRVCRLIRFTPSTTTRFFSGSTDNTRPFLPRSLPARTITWSFLRIDIPMALQHLWSERDDLHEAALAQFAGNGPEHARADRLTLVVDQHRRIAVEADVAAVLAALLLAHADDHGLDDLALLDLAFRRRLFHVGGDDVAEIGITPGRAADRVNHGNLPRPRVVGDVENRSHLDHGVPLCVVCAICGLYLCRALDDAHQGPSLALAERPRLGDHHGVADLGLVLLVVRHEGGG